jgi:hypothetical protein
MLVKGRKRENSRPRLEWRLMDKGERWGYFGVTRCREYGNFVYLRPTEILFFSLSPWQTNLGLIAEPS